MPDAHPTSEATSGTDVVIAVIRRNGKVLICQRPSGKSFAGLWEFPGGKREGGETLAGCLEREVWEELALRVRPRTALTPVQHDYPRGRIRLHPYLCDHVEGEPQALASQAVKWVEPEELRSHQFPPANDRLIDEVIAALHLHGDTQRTAP